MSKKKTPEGKRREALAVKMINLLDRFATAREAEEWLVRNKVFLGARTSAFPVLARLPEDELKKLIRKLTEERQI